MDPVKATDLKLALDSMLCGLSKKLRIHGVDAVVIETFEEYENCAKIARRDQRMVLTKGSKHYIKLRQLVAKGTCLSLLEDKPDDQVSIYSNTSSFSRQSGRSKLLEGVGLGPNLQ